MKEGHLTHWSKIFVTAEILVCVLGTLFNGVVIFTISKNIYRRISASTYLILSIAVSDFLSCAIAAPLLIARHFRAEWPFGMAGCKAYAFMIFLLAIVSITHLAAISVGKYLTITRTVNRQSYFSKTNVMLLILASWIYSFGFSVAPLLGWSRYGLEGANATCSLNWESSFPSDQAYFGVAIFNCYVFPLALITFCYYKIHQVSKQIVVNTTHVGRLALTARQVLLKKHRRSAMYFLYLIAAFMTSWSPYAVVCSLLVLGLKVDPVVHSACSVFAKISFCLNPMLYALCNRKFRRRFVRSVPLKRPKKDLRPSVLRSISHSLALWSVYVIFGF